MSSSGRATRFAVATVEPAGAAVTAGFQPVANRWTWQPRLPELWLRVEEGLRFRELIEQQKREV